MATHRGWIDRLGYDRLPGSFFESAEDCPAEHPFAVEIRSALRSGLSHNLVASGIFCVDRVPTIYLLDQSKLSHATPVRSEQVRLFCEQLWNQNLARVVLVVRADSIEAWSIDNPKVKPEKFGIDETKAISAWSVDGLLSGKVLRGRDSWFDPKKRVDNILLDSVRVLLSQLGKNEVEPAAARELVAKIVFVAYLEDKKIVTDQYRTQRRVGDIFSLVSDRDRPGIKRLFTQLKKDFNGDFLRPSSQAADVWKELSDETLNLIRDFLARTVLRSGQRDMWRYDFSQIPIELISGIYETFLSVKGGDGDTPNAATKQTGEVGDERRMRGAYYTPRLLADWVVELSLDGRDILQERIFDGACGSGMLLTSAFRRLMRAQQAFVEKKGLGDRAIGFGARCRLLRGHIFGGDVDEDACRLTAFSLYLALLSDLEPRDLAILQRGGHKLPRLDKNIRRGRAGDFFSKQAEIENRRHFTLFLSNPPWRQLRLGEDSARSVDAWIDRQPKPTPHVPSRQIAAAFALGAADTLRAGGRAALILPINLFVSAEKSQRRFRKHLLGRFRVERIVNFSDMRRLIFVGAVHPFVVLIASARALRQRYRSIADERIEYWTPKTDVTLAFGRLAVHGADRADLLASTLIDEKPHLGLRYWGTEQDVALLDRLWRHGRVRNLIESKAGWLSAKGFHIKDEDRRRPQSTWYADPPAWMRQRPFLDAKRVPSDQPFVDQRLLTPFPFSKIARAPDKKIFEGPRVLWPDGTHPETGVKAVYAEDQFSFQHSLGVLCAPSNEVGRLTARFLTAYLRSPLGIWLSLLLSSSVASERPKLHLQELLEWPFWETAKHPNPLAAQEILKKVDHQFDLIERAPELTRVARYAEVKPAMDRLVFDYFNLAKDERAIVEEMADYAGPSLQPASLTYAALNKPLRAAPSLAMLRSYCHRLGQVFHRWRDATGGIGEVSAVPWTGQSVPIGAAILTLNSSNRSARERINDDTVLTDLVASFSQATRTLGDDILRIPNLTIVKGNTITIVKPLVARFWLQRSATEDAARMVADIQALER